MSILTPIPATGHADAHHLPADPSAARARLFWLHRILAQDRPSGLEGLPVKEETNWLEAATTSLDDIPENRRWPAFRRRADYLPALWPR